MTHERRAQWDFPTSTFKLKAAFPVSAYVHSPEASPGSPVLPMLDSRWSMLGAGCTSSVSTGVCGDEKRERFYSASPHSRQKNWGDDDDGLNFPSVSAGSYLLSTIKAGLSHLANSNQFYCFIKKHNHCWELLLLLTGLPPPHGHLSLRVKQGNRVQKKSWFEVKKKKKKQGNNFACCNKMKLDKM